MKINEVGAVAIIAFVIIVLGAVIGMTCQSTPESIPRSQQDPPSWWFSNQVVGGQFTPDWKYVIVEDNTEFRKYRFYDGEIGHPDFVFITVKKGVIVAVFHGNVGR